MKKNDPVWLNIGSGVNLAGEFINVDNFFDLEDLKNGIKTKKGPFKNARIAKGARFVRADVCDLPFEDNSVDYIECNDMIEHLPFSKVLDGLKEMYRVLKPGSKLCLSTVNFDELARLWTSFIEGNLLKGKHDWDMYISLAQVIYGNQAGEGEYHKTPFNPFTLGSFFHSAGFKLDNIVISVYPTGSPYVTPQKVYKSLNFDFKGKVILTEQLWVEATK